MIKFRFLFLLFLLLSPLSLQAMNGIIWQPQDQDLSVSDSKWQDLMRKVRQEGFDTLVLQWTRYGDSFSTPERREQLRNKVESAREAGLKLILGLYMDPEFFSRQKQPVIALSNYLNRLRVLDINQISLWQEALSFEPDGWYISAEIDDLNWRDESIRQQMLVWLKETRNQIRQHSPQPVYISTFFAGNMTPASYRDLLETMQAQGLKVWVQDGSGVDVLTEAQRTLYLNELFDCSKKNKAAVSGIVYELFTVKKGDTFSAAPKSKTEIKKLLAHHLNCPVERLYFSLRYLPISAGVLE